MRQYILFTAALMALIGSTVAVWATTTERDYELRGYVDPTLNSNLPMRIPLLGVNAELSQYTTDELSQHLTWMEQAHIHWVRQIFPWNEIEPNNNQFQWESWDTIVNTIDQHPNLRLVAVLMNSPQWSRNSKILTAPPNDPTIFADFARAFAERYKQQIDYYQIWDEPNLDDAWGNTEPRAADYLALLQAGYKAIHSADEGAIVITAALAPTTEYGPDNIADVLYLHDLYKLGARDFMDAVAAKPYGFDKPALDRTVDIDVLNFSRIVALREEMIRNDDGTKALWASHWGWNSLPDNWSGRDSIWGEVTEENRIQYTLTALDRAEREWPWLGGMILQHWQPADPTDDPQWGFALIDQQGEPTTLWNALANRPQPTTAQNGLFPPNNPFARYSGVWTFSDFGADIGWLKDSQLDFEFNGQDIALLLRRDNYIGYLYPTIDGKPANATAHDADGNAYVILTSGSLEPEKDLNLIGHNLGMGLHRLHVVADRGWDRWALAGYAVSSGNLAEPYNRQINISWFVVAAATASVVITGWKIPWKRAFAPASKLWQSLSDTGQFAISALTSVALMLGMLLTWGDSTPNLLRREHVQIILAIITAGIVYLQPQLIVTIVTIILLLIILYNRPVFGLYLTIFYAPFFLFPVELYRFAFPMAELTILITTSAWALRMLAAWGRIRQNAISNFTPPSIKSHLQSLHPLDYGVICWFALGFISLLWTAKPPQAITELRVFIIEPTLFYLILRTTLTDKRETIRLVDFMLLAGVVVAIIGLGLFLQGEGVITAEEGAGRLASVYGSPNNVGLFLGRCIPFALAYTITKTDPIRRIAAPIALSIMGIAALLTQSAGTIFVGIPAAIIAVFLARWGKHAWFAVVTLMSLATAILLFASRSARFARLFDFTSGTNFYRLRVWESAINIIHDYPITGIGLDQFLYMFRGRYILPDAWQEPNLSHPHNFILDFWVRLGIFGVIVFFAIQVAFWKTIKHLYAYYRAHNPLYFAMIAGVIGSMVNLLAHGLVDNSVFVQDLTYVFVLLLGVTAQLSNKGAIDD